MTAGSIVIDELSNKFERHFRSTIDVAYSADSELDRVIHYILGGSGKRVRPLLTLLSGHVFGAPFEKCYAAALAVEFVHAYSLVHDDLPCMDNDTYRRGRLTAHVQFNETMALLGGDAILADAFQVLSTDRFRGVPLQQPAPDVRAALVAELANSIGSGGMVLGQVLDLHWTGRDGYSENDLTKIHQLKTGRLIACSCALGAILGGASPSDIERLRRFGDGIGLAYQIIDDLLDDCDGIGKSTGKDRAAGKLTYLSVMSRDQANAMASKITSDALACLDAIEGGGARDTQCLVAYAHHLLRRKY